MAVEIVLFGDQTADYKPFLKDALSRKGFPILTSFLEQGGRVLREEVAALPARWRDHIPPFSNVRELAERQHDFSPQEAALESALTSLAHLAHFISIFEDRPLEYPKATNSRIVGICTGVLAAAAVASCDSLTSLMPLAVEVVRIAFRIGHRVACIADLIEQRPHGQDYNWSTVVLGLGGNTAKIAVETFNLEQGLHCSNKLYISAISRTSVTVSGPPTSRKHWLRVCASVNQLRYRDIAIGGPYHAPHLYPLDLVEDLILPGCAAVMSQYRALQPVFSSTASLHVPAMNTLDLMRQCMVEVLMEPMHWDNAVESCITSLATETTPCRVLAIASMTLGNSLASTLKACQIETSLDGYASWMPYEGKTLSGYRSRISEAKIAIIGMAGRYPDAENNEKLWELLENGLDVHREIPPDRFDAQAHTDPSGAGKNMSHTPYGCFIEKPGVFDPRFFGMSPREAENTDPMQRLALTTAYEAMEMAGLVVNRTPSTQAHRIATFYGQTSDDWREINAAQDIDTYFIPGGVRAFGPGKINYHFKFSGPSYSIDTACSSSLAAIQLACTSLRAGECDTVFAGGMNVMTNADIFAGLSKGQFLSKTGSCKTYDNDADGYCRGDGVATVILKRLEDAELDRDPILGVICATATNHSAQAVSITHPHAESQQTLFHNVMNEAAVKIHDVSYVEMHGTGTQAGDGIEMESVSNVFAPRDPLQRRPAEKPLFLGSVKSNIGHGEAVSGVSALTKVLLMFQKNTIPPHCGIKGTINQAFPTDLKDRNAHIAFEPKPFPRLTATNQHRYVFLNNFSAAGGNTALLLEDSLEGTPLTKDPRSTSIVVVSAKSARSFKQNILNLLSWVHERPTTDLSSLGYTTTARRKHYNYRVAIDASNRDQLLARLTSTAEAPHVPISGTNPKVAFVFTGQGCQYAAMGKNLYESSKDFSREIDTLNRIAVGQGFPPFRDLISGTAGSTANENPVSIQLAITCLEIALAHLWQSWGIQPSVVVGHSLGEYAALHVAGVLSVVDVIYLVGKRAQLLLAGCSPHTHGMLAVRATIKRVDYLLKDLRVEVACVNSPEDIVFSGTIDDIIAAEMTLASQGIKCRKLDVPFAFHSAQVDPILESFEELAESVTFQRPIIPLLSPLLSEAVDQPSVIGPSYLKRHCRDTVNFLGCLKAAFDNRLISEGVQWVEIGPHPICLSMIRATLGSRTAISGSIRRDQDNWMTISSSLSTLYGAGVPVVWSEYHRDFESGLRVLPLPSYAFDEKVYWLQYKNNWTLQKGDGLPSKAVDLKMLTTGVQRIVSKEVKGDTVRVVGESDFFDPLLRSVVTGHLVNGVALCPSSLYAEIALTICDYAYKALRPSAIPSMNVRNMEVLKPLIVNATSAKHQTIQIETKLDLQKSNAHVSFCSTLIHGGPSTEHAKCVVEFEEMSKWRSKWDRQEYLINSRINMLKRQKGVSLVQRGMAYKLFSALVQYDKKYQGMEEVLLESSELEGTSRVCFQATSKDGDFFMNPYFIDSVAHLAGFIMNANDTVDSTSHVYINHGWETMRFAEKLLTEETYRSYVKMQPVAEGKKLMAGDVYVFKDEKVIGVIEGLTFQCVPRAVLSSLLGVREKAPKIPLDSSALRSRESRKRSKLGSHGEPSSTSFVEAASDKRKGTRGTTTSALDIVATEIGCEIPELADPILLADLGVDSLMALAISGRFREELELDISGSLFNKISTIGELKAYLGPLDISTQEKISSSSTSSASSTILRTPRSRSGSRESRHVEQSEEGSLIDDEIISTIRSTIALEIGTDTEDVTNSTNLSELGVDSLMSLAILGALREKTGLALSPDLFARCSSVGDILNDLGLKPAQRHLQIERTMTDLISDHLPLPTSDFIPSFPPAQSVLLQGFPHTASQTLFLLPDGSGSATSYTTIPPLCPSNLAIYGLNCPFMKTPDLFTIGIPAVAHLYLAEIKRRQPHGPYLLGGWSAGGVLALEVTRQLAIQSEAVSRLILIDSPCPIGLEALPSSFHRFCDSIGLLGNGKTPSWLLPHFAATVRELTTYSESLGLEPRRLLAGEIPQTTIIWARDGLVKHEGDPTPEWEKGVRMPNSMQWLVENRRDLGPAGWDTLLGNAEIRCESVEGNHFTMMREPIIHEVGRLIKEAVA
ncbi:hypothetical protein MMC13_005229 [Lambiella insularis]|nr:hypothetical protein [Lambiella insularis]